MAKKKPTQSVVEPRKEPKQERSRQTFQDILSGARQVISRDGIHRMSTNKVAEESGVSIGSLYQYFPSKEAIVAALIEQMIEEEYNRFRDHIEAATPKAGARHIIKNLFKSFYQGEKSDLMVKRALINFVPIVDKTSEAIKFHRAVAELILSYFSTHYHIPPPRRDQETTTYVLQYILRGLLLGSVGEGLEKINLENLLGEITDTILQILEVPEKYRAPQV